MNQSKSLSMSNSSSRWRTQSKASPTPTPTSKSKTKLTTPLTTASPSPRPKTGAAEDSYEQLLMEQLVAMMAVVLRSSALKVRGNTTHDQELVSRHISQHRAVDAVQEELELILAKLERIQGKRNSTSHRMSSYHQLFANLLNDIEASIFNEDRLKLEQIRDEQQIVKQESNKLHKSLTDKLAKRDQLVSALEQENNELSDRNSFLEQQNEILMKSLDKSNHGLMDVHQKAVEMRMQGLDFKAEVDRRCNKLLNSVQSRMGFVPSGIQKHIHCLKILKPPGDPEYDLIRNSILSQNQIVRNRNQDLSIRPTESSSLRQAIPQSIVSIPTRNNNYKSKSSPSSSPRNINGNNINGRVLKHQMLSFHKFGPDYYNEKDEVEEYEEEEETVVSFDDHLTCSDLDSLPLPLPAATSTSILKDYYDQFLHRSAQTVDTFVSDGRSVSEQGSVGVQIYPEEGSGDHYLHNYNNNESNSYTNNNNSHIRRSGSSLNSRRYDNIEEVESLI